MLLILLFSFTINSDSAQALNVNVQDQDESLVADDFAYYDLNMHPIGGFDNKIAIRQETGNFSTIKHLDIQNIKFFYHNGNITAEILIKEGGNYNFTNGTTYGMAININNFRHSVPEIADADYIYRYILNNKDWYRVLAIAHTSGQEENITSSPTNLSKFFNENKHYIRMNFNTKEIGSPEEFQVLFFAAGIVRVPSNQSYFVIDYIPWIEVPQPRIFVSLEPPIHNVYPNDNKKVNLIINSTSKVPHRIQLCQNEACINNATKSAKYNWEFKENGVEVPPTGSYTVPTVLSTGTINEVGDDFELFYRDAPVGVAGVLQVPVPLSKTWHLTVSSPLYDLAIWLADLPVRYPYIVSAVSFLGGFLFHRNHKLFSSKAKKLLSKLKKDSKAVKEMEKGD